MTDAAENLEEDTLHVFTLLVPLSFSNVHISNCTRRKTLHIQIVKYTCKSPAAHDQLPVNVTFEAFLISGFTKVMLHSRLVGSWDVLGII